MNYNPQFFNFDKKNMQFIDNFFKQFAEAVHEICLAGGMSVKKSGLVIDRMARYLEKKYGYVPTVIPYLPVPHETAHVAQNALVAPVEQVLRGNN